MVVERVRNMVLMRLPRAVMAAMHTTAIRASSRPYSASVAPSSCRVTNLRKNLRAAVRCFIEQSPERVQGQSTGRAGRTLPGSDGPGGTAQRGAEPIPDGADAEDAHHREEGQEQGVLHDGKAFLVVGDE